MAQSDTALSVLDRSFFFNATPWHRVTPLCRSETDLFFLTPPGAHNLLTPPRGTERHCFLRPPQPAQQAFPYGLGAKNEERESKTTRKNGASKREGRRHPVAQSDTALSDRDRCCLFFPLCHLVVQRRHSPSPRPKRYFVFSLV